MNCYGSGTDACINDRICIISMHCEWFYNMNSVKIKKKGINLLFIELSPASQRVFCILKVLTTSKYTFLSYLN